MVRRHPPPTAKPKASAARAGTARQQAIEACFAGTLSLPRPGADAASWKRGAGELLRLSVQGAIDVEALAAHLAAQPATAEVVVFLVHLASMHAINARQRSAAEAKHRKAREWVVSQWFKRRELLETKAAFCRRVAPLIERRFGAKVSPEWMARCWIPRDDGWAGYGGRDYSGPRPIAWTGRPHIRK